MRRYYGEIYETKWGIDVLIYCRFPFVLQIIFIYWVWTPCDVHIFFCIAVGMSYTSPSNYEEVKSTTMLESNSSRNESSPSLAHRPPVPFPWEGCCCLVQARKISVCSGPPSHPGVVSRRCTPLGGVYYWLHRVYCFGELPPHNWIARRFAGECTTDSSVLSLPGGRDDRSILRLSNNIAYLPRGWLQH